METRGGESDDGVALCRDEEIPELREFQRRMYGDEHRLLDPARFDWLFFRHPYRSGVGPAVWICRRDGKIVGTQGGLPIELQVCGERHRAFWGIELMVDAPWRGHGVGPALTTVLRKVSKAACGLSVSDAARRSLVRMGSTDMGTMPMYFRLIDASGYSTWTGAANPRFARARFLVFPSLWLLDRISNLRSKGVELLSIDAFDERADTIWQSVAPSYRVISHRGAAWLRWRFDESPERLDYRRYYAVRRQKLIGYVVLRPTTWNGAPALSIVDYLARPCDMAATLACAVRVARHDRVTALLCNTLNAQATRAMLSVGFLRRRNQGFQILMYTPDNDSAGQALRDPANWFLTSADSDIDQPVDVRPS
jgi:GNAT superfamily N-acetyltransferase